jgi:tetratricopeptide (TPR) repeat protein
LNQYVYSLLKNPSPGSVKNGIKLLTGFHEQSPEIAETLYYLMMLQSEQKEYAQALETAGKAETLFLKNNNTNLLNGTFYYQYASLYERTGQSPEAEKLFFKVIESGEMPVASAAKNYIAYMWAERGEKLDLALTLIQDALKTQPENGAFLDTLGWIYYMQGQYDKALDELKKACGITGDDPTILEHLGDTYLKLGRTAEAVQQWEKALKIDPESPRLLERLKANRITSDVCRPAENIPADKPLHP